MFANSLLAPYCGSNHDFEAVRWLDDAASVASTVILPLRSGGTAFGLLILGSPDAQRFRADMATDFLIHIGETKMEAGRGGLEHLFDDIVLCISELVTTAVEANSSDISLSLQSDAGRIRLSMVDHSDDAPAVLTDSDRRSGEQVQYMTRQTK